MNNTIQVSISADTLGQIFPGVNRDSVNVAASKMIESQLLLSHALASGEGNRGEDEILQLNQATERLNRLLGIE